MKPTSPWMTLVLRGLLAALICCTACRDEPPEAAPPPAPEPSAAPASGMPLAFLAGTYEVVGRHPDSDDLYAGTVVFGEEEADSTVLSVTRTVGDVVTSGIATMARATADAVPVLRVVFDADGQPMEATYLITVDLDNYARLTGYVYRQDGETRTPGLEALFHER